MKVRVNGEEREVAEGITIEGLLREIGAPTEAVAIAVDGVVIPRASRTTTLHPGARVEVIRAVGGG